MTVQNDPFSVISQLPPSLNDDEARALVLLHWGLNVKLRSLISERDQNFRLTSDAGNRFVLKIANAAEDPVVTDFQIQALMHIERYKAAHDIPVIVPVVMPTLERQGHVVINRQGENHVVRIVSYVDGVPLSEVQPGNELFGNLGACLAHLGQALREFKHAGAGQNLLWDMKSALRLHELLSVISDDSLRDNVSDCLDDFERDVLPILPSLRAQVIHNDFNPDNVLVDANDNDQPAGVIDFGDMLGSPLIFDLAVAASYLRAPTGDPLSHIAEFVAGYHAVTPLEQAEIDLLPGLILLRLCTTITILSWRESVRGADDPYLRKAAATESSADVFLGRLLELPRENMRNTLRQVCASVDANRL